MADSWAVGIDDVAYTVTNENENDPGPTPWATLRMHPLLRNAVAKAQWGERHLAALKHNIDAFFGDPSHRAAIRADLDAQSAYHIFTIASVADMALIREQFALALADVAGNLREALGQFAWQLACDFATDGRRPERTAVHFPIRDSADDFAKKESRARRQFDPRHWEFFDRFQPYHGVAGRPDRWLGPYVHPLSLLRDLSNDDKHEATEPVLLIASQFHFRVEIDGAPDWQFDHTGETAELGSEVMRARLVAGSEPHIDNAGEMTPQVAISERRAAVPTLARLGGFVHLMLSEFARGFPAEP